MSKTCKSCGRELPDAAAFCPHCETVQTDKQQVTPPRRWRKRALGIAALVLVLVLAVGTGWYLTSRNAPEPEIQAAPEGESQEALLPEEEPAEPVAEEAEGDGPQVYEGGAEVVYGDYHLLLTYFTQSGSEGTAHEAVEPSVRADQSLAYPSQFFALKNTTKEDRWEEFSAELESVTLETIPEEGADQMEFREPRHDEGFAPAGLISDITYTASCGTNEIRWTFHMKNGDTIILRQYIHATLRETAIYRYEETPMDTLEELQALLDTIDQEVDPETSVVIYLPPVTYAGGLTLENRTYTFYGSTEWDNRTTFTDTVEIKIQNPQVMEIYGVNFTGNGGVGVDASESVVMEDCTFTGWDTALLAEAGGWACVDRSVFKDNGVGLHVDCRRTTYFGDTFEALRFLGNGTGILFTSVPNDILLFFPECIFSGNETDIDNQIGAPLDTSGATFE